MSANPGRKPTTPEEKEALKNETPAQTLVRLGGPRVTKLLDSMDKVGNLGHVIKSAAAQGVDPNQVIGQISNAVAAKYQEMLTRLQTGEQSKSVFSIKV